MRRPHVTTMSSRPSQPKPEAARVGQQPSRSRKSLRRILLLAGPLVVLAGALYFYLTGGRFASTDDAYVKADIVSIATDISGIVAKVDVHNDQHVKAGDVLFQLDDEPYRIALEGAKAQLGATANQIDALKASYRQQLQPCRTHKMMSLITSSVSNGRRSLPRAQSPHRQRSTRRATIIRRHVTG